MMIYIDNVNGSSSVQRYLELDSGNVVSLNARDESIFKRLSTGDKLRVTGSYEGNNFFVSSIETPFQLQADSAPIPKIGNRTVAVMLVNFMDDTREPYTVQYAQNHMFNDVDSWFREVSYDKMSISGDVYGWITLNISSTCAYYDIRSAGLQWGRDNDVDLYSYDHVYFVFPRQGCGWAGVANVGGKFGWTDAFLDMRVTTHELGHNLGLRHAHGLNNCGGTPMKIPLSQCSSREYDDRYDAMGRYTPKHFGAAYKEKLGWLENSDVIDVGVDGTYDLGVFQNKNTSNKVLKVTSLMEGNPFYYYIEHRENYGWDTGLPNNVTNGALIRIYDPATRSVSRQHILNMNYQESNNKNAALEVGRVFTEPGRNIQFETVEKTPGNLKVKVTFDVAESAGELDFVTTAATTWESNPPLNIYVRRRNGLKGAVSINYRFIDETATSPEDYAGASGTINYAAGESGQKIISIPIEYDYINEGDETFRVVLENPTNGASLGPNSQLTVTIRNQKRVGAQVRLKETSVSLLESAGPVTMALERVRLQGVPADPITVNYRTINDSAKSGEDFVDKTGSIQFGQDEITTKNVLIDLVNDETFEPDEKFRFRITYTINSQGSQDTVKDTAIITIENDDQIPNLRPVVNAGEDKEIDFPGDVTLSPTVEDDGLPNDKLTFKWEKVSQGGSAHIFNMTDLETRVSFEESGEYVFRISADDGELVGADDVLVNVNAPEGAGGQTNVGIGSRFVNVFRPGKSNLTIPCQNNIEIYTIQGLKVRGLSCVSYSPDQTHAIWDGRNDSGDMVTSGQYIVREPNKPIRKAIAIK